MDASSFSQPEPYAPGPAPVPTVRTVPRSRRLLLPIVGGLVIAVVAFGGGFAVANAMSSSTTTRTGGNGIGGGGQGFGGGGPGASGRPRNGFGGGGASGTVGTVAADQMTITTATGGQRIVLLTPTTTVTEVSSATKTATDIATGQTVTVVGTTNPDGSVTATSVIIGNVSVFGRGFGGGQGPEPSSTP